MHNRFKALVFLKINVKIDDDYWGDDTEDETVFFDQVEGNHREDFPTSAVEFFSDRLPEHYDVLDEMITIVQNPVLPLKPKQDA